MSAPTSLVSRLRARVPAGVIVAAVYVVLAVVVTISAWRAPSVTYIGEGPDPIQGMWAIGWVPFAASHGLNPLLSTSMNAPTGFDLLWPDPFSIPLILFWPVTALFGATVTYNLVITLSLALASFFAYLVIRRWVPGVVAAACGGLLYGFSPYMTGQMLGHISLVLAGVTPPLALMLLDEIVVRQRRSPRTLGLLAALLAVVQFFISQEILLTEILAAALVTIVLALTHRDLIRSHIGFVARTLGAAAVPAVILLAYPTWLQFLGPGHVLTSGAIHGNDIYVTNALNFVVPSVAQLISPPVATGISSHFSGNASEWDAYLGIPLVLLLIAATVRFWSVPVIRTAGIVALIIAVLSLGPHLNINGHPILAVPLPWWIPDHLPVLDDILPNRLMVYVDLAAAITFAFSLRILWLLRSSLALNVVVAIAVLLPLAPTLPVPATTLTTSAPFASDTEAAAFSGADVLFEPYPSLDYPDAMIWQRTAGYTFIMTGGYIIGPNAPGSDDLQRHIFDLTSRSATVTLTGADQLTLAGEFRTLGIDTVVVGAGATPGMASLFTQFLGRAPIHDHGFLVWRFPPFH
jgi:hypothetical protein